jgi:CheY-like chemotaxis protein/signal transduction histidine kinase/HAMP domain-containing protein
MQIGFSSLQARLRASFALIIGLGLCVGLIGLQKMHDLSHQRILLYEHPFTVGHAVREIRASILRMDFLLDRVSPELAQDEAGSIERDLRELDILVMTRFETVQERFLGDKRDARVALDAYLAFKPLLDERLSLLRHASPQSLAKDNKKRFALALDHLDRKCQALVDFATEKAKALHEAARDEERSARNVILFAMLVLTVSSMLLAELLAKAVSGPLKTIARALKRIAAGEFRDEILIERRDEIGTLADAFREMQIKLQSKTALAEAIAHGDLSREFETGPLDRLGLAMQRMTEALREADKASKREDWLKTGINECNTRIAGSTSLEALAHNALSFLAAYLGAQVGALYVAQDDKRLFLAGEYAGADPAKAKESVVFGQGLAGQAAEEQRSIVVNDAPPGFLRISSGLGEAAPTRLVATPLLHEGRLAGVIELGAFQEFSQDALTLLQLLAQSLAIAIQSIRINARLKTLLDESQLQALKLQQQSEELRVANEELAENAKILRQSEEELTLQQEELQTANEELQEKTSYLENQRKLISEKNEALETAQSALKSKAEEMARASQYKSDFLANMSHELRTPLNSILILARNLSENLKNALTSEQAEAAKIIHQSGDSLLYLINDILDLSKIEAGKMTLHLEAIFLEDIADAMYAIFKPEAQEKGLTLRYERDPALPKTLRSDRHRLEQILKNLLNNAIKFTEKGEVALRFHRPEGPDAIGELRSAGFDPDRMLAVTVSDTGVGVPSDKQQEIFESFRQADGSTSRKYGGAGLGLAISRELARMLGGDIRLLSAPEQGASFTAYLPFDGPSATGEPQDLQAPREPRPAPPMAGPPKEQRFETNGASGFSPCARHELLDDRAALLAQNGALLIVEDDPGFAKTLLSLCRSKGFKALCAASAEEGLELAFAHAPMAVLLDLKLPGMSGWDFIDRLHSDPSMRHIPVHVISGQDVEMEALRRGAVGFLSKPATPEALDRALSRLGAILDKKVKDLLVIEDDPALRKAVIDLLSDGDVLAVEAADGASALNALRRKRFDCMVLDLGLPDMSGIALLRQLEQEGLDPIPPVIVYTGRDLTREEEMELYRFSSSIIIKTARSEDRLLDEAALFLHRMVESLPDGKQRKLARILDSDAVFLGKKILVVDDDMRNLFAVAHILEQKGVEVVKAENGRRALDILEEHPDVSLVLLDIMMPVMDGYETLERLRARKDFASLPVIALTAKARQEDRKKCLAAGASDYLSKPLDLDRFLSLLRVWLSG